MIIVDQKRTWLVNFSNIIHIDLGVNKEKKEYAIIAKTNTGDEIIIGEYATEERTKEVLQEIVICYANIEMLGIPNVKINENITTYDLKRNIAYEMPKE